MGGALRKTMIYLGLAEDDDRYDGYDVYEDEEPEAMHVEEEPLVEPRRAPVTPIGAGPGGAGGPAAAEAGEMHRITTIHPRVVQRGQDDRRELPRRHSGDHEPHRHGGRRRQAPGGLRGGPGVRSARFDRAGDQQGVPALARRHRGGHRGAGPRPGTGLLQSELRLV